VDTEKTFQARLPGLSQRFLRTGDLGFVQATGLFIVGRLKELLIIRGKNYPPEGIESIVTQCHPGLEIDCCAAFQVERGGFERLVVACEINTRRPIDYEPVVRSIRQAVFINTELEVDTVVMSPLRTIPKTPTDKIQRLLCRSLFLESRLPAAATWSAECGLVTSPPSEPRAASRRIRAGATELPCSAAADEGPGH
jgi:acyl-CoA synthetase (AMP-forming)/AMP-acid ligase II